MTSSPERGSHSMTAGTVDKKWTKKIRTVPPVMVLKESSDARLRFLFRSLLWGIGTTPFAVLLCYLACGMTYHHDAPLYLRIFVYILAMAFTYSTIKSFTTSRSLEIDFIRRVVILYEKTLFSETTRSDGFDQFRRITVCRSDVNSANYAIVLEYKDGWMEYLGWSEFGAMSLAKAMELVNKIAPPMGIEINAPTYFDEKPLKGKQGGVG